MGREVPALHELGTAHSDLVPVRCGLPGWQQPVRLQRQERIAKTPKAWEALSRPDLIGRRAHSLLLMANGRRSERELSALLEGYAQR